MTETYVPIRWQTQTSAGISISPMHKYLLFLERLINDRCPTLFNGPCVVAIMYCFTAICVLLSKGNVEISGALEALVN